MNKLFRIIFVLSIFFLNYNFIFAKIFSRDGIYYQIIDESRVIVVENPGQNYSGDVYIPEEVSILGEERTFKVEGIKHNIFSNNFNLLSVNMENCNILRLPRFLFFNCQRLRNICFPLSLRLIGASSFSNCSNINTLVIPHGVEVIEDFAFSDCHNLEAVYLPDSLKYLGQGAFRNCDKLVSVALPKNLEFVEERCFENCVSLRHVFFGDKIKQICRFAFKNCPRLENIDLPSSLKVIRLSAFARCDSMDEVCIPENVEELSSTSFGYCFGIKKIIFKGQCPPKKFVDDAFAYPNFPFPGLDPIEIVVPEGTIKRFKRKIECKIKNRDCVVREESENILYP